MELYEAKVETVASATLPWQETLLMPIGDVQVGAGGGACDEDRFKRHMEWGMKQNAYFLGMGDYVDVASPSNRQRLRAANLYDSVEDMLEEAAQRDYERFLKLVKGTEGRWLGLLEGHHYYDFRDGTTSDTRIAQALRAPFLGSCAFVRLRFIYPSSKTHITATIWCHHGTGSGAKQAAPLNRLENIMAYFDADIFLIGHYQRKSAAPIDQLYMTRKKPHTLRHRTKIIAATGGFTLSYMQSSKSGGRPRGNYAERGMMSPVALGGVVIRLRPVKGDAPRLDLNVEL